MCILIPKVADGRKIEEMAAAMLERLKELQTYRRNKEKETQWLELFQATRPQQRLGSSGL